MRKTGLRLFGVMAMLIILLMSGSVAHAAPNTGRGIYLDGAGYDGLRAVISTMVGTGSPPAFTFPTKSPDVYQHFSSQLHPKNSCVQLNVLQERIVGSGTTTHKIEMVNWCAGAISGTWLFDLTNATFRSSYVRTISYNDTGTSFQDEVIDTRIYQTNAGTNQWTMALYNYTTSTWDVKTTSQGTVAQPSGYVDIGDGGYTQDPTIACPTLYPWGIMELRGIQKRTTSTGVWANIAAGDITGTIADAWPCLSNNTWTERRGTAYQFKIVPFGAAY